MKKLAKNLSKSLFWAALCLSLNGCFIRPYKFDMYQGNVITQDKVAQIEPGMSQEQVRYVLGTPVLNDVFHTQRWDYIYMEKPGFGKEKRRHLAIYFNDGRVDRVSQDSLQDVA